MPDITDAELDEIQHNATVNQRSAIGAQRILRLIAEVRRLRSESKKLRTDLRDAERKILTPQIHSEVQE